MVVKQSPGDFVVEELTAVHPAGGEHALYRLEKVGWTTPDALAVVEARWKLDRRRVSFGGLKDRHATTTQHITVFRGPPRGMTHDRIRLTYLGQTAEPFAAQHISANRFAVVVRNLPTAAEDSIRQAAAEIEAVGVPNYFDDQRFGSVGPGGEFVARLMVAGRFEDALKLALIGEYEYDRTAAKREKEVLRSRWGDWRACLRDLPRGPTAELVAFLAARPGDFRGAVARLHPELQGLHLAAYQSHVWNRMLARWLNATVPAECLTWLPTRLGDRPAPRALPADGDTWLSLSLPLPSARVRPADREGWGDLAAAVLAEDGLTLAEMKVPGLRKPFFSKGDRAACLRPAALKIDVTGDDRHAGRAKATLTFDLPRGAYATMVVKRLTSPPRAP